MIEIGKKHVLTVDRIKPQGAYLSNGMGDEMLLPTRYFAPDTKVDGTIEVFVYRDSEDRLIATTDEPLAYVNEFACLKVVDVNRMGAFLDWGLDKDLLVPYKQQNKKMQIGEWHLIYLYLDEQTNRLVATSKIQPMFDRKLDHLNEGDSVDILVGPDSDLGHLVVVNQKHQGMIFHSEIHQDLMIGDQLTGFIKSIRDDNKLDISLQQTGIAHIEAGAQLILDVLKENNGQLDVNDKSSPEDIQFYFQLSKKAFKRSIGQLYKQRLIKLTDEGIELN